MNARAKAPPLRSAWRPLSSLRPTPAVVEGAIYARGRLRVVSSLDLAELPDGSGETGPQWHVSISRLGGRRASDKEVSRTLRAFELSGAEEDNHHPGLARHFWMPVDPARRSDCECKDTEAVVVEPDGYRWTNPHVGAGACRGCEFERVLRGGPCPIHSAEARGV